MITLIIIALLPVLGALMENNSKMTKIVAIIIGLLIGVSASGQVWLVSQPVPPHGAFAFHDSSITLDMSSGVWSMVTNPTSTLFISQDEQFLSFDGDSLTIEQNGDYAIDISLSFSGTASDQFEIAYFKNAVMVEVSMQRSTSQTDVGNMSLPVYIEELESGDDITFKIRNTASNDDATLISCSWIIWRLHK